MQVQKTCYNKLNSNIIVDPTVLKVSLGVL